MEHTERREHPRHKIETAVNAYVEGRRIPATIRDVSQSGLGLVSERRLAPSSKVVIRFIHADNYTIRGTVEWAILTGQGDQFLYRTGIRIDKVLSPEDIAKVSS